MNHSALVPREWKRRLRERLGAVTLSGRLQNLRRAGFLPRTIVDAGAFRGEWTSEVLGIYPEADFLLIEPQASVRRRLEELTARRRNLHLRTCLLGREPGEIKMLVEGSNSRVMPADWQPPAGAVWESHRVETLASALEAAGLDGCDFLKLDLQGHELEALAGAGALFGSIEVIMTEVSWLRIGDVPLVHEVIADFVAHGYLPYDSLGHNYRRRDRALWQTDMIFVRADSALVASRSWA